MRSDYEAVLLLPAARRGLGFWVDFMCSRFALVPFFSLVFDKQINSEKKTRQRLIDRRDKMCEATRLSRKSSLLWKFSPLLCWFEFNQSDMSKKTLKSSCRSRNRKLRNRKTWKRHMPALRKRTSKEEKSFAYTSRVVLTKLGQKSYDSMC